MPVERRIITDRRAEPRLMCADLVTLGWRDDGGRTRETVANVEDISPAGMCVEIDFALRPDTAVWVVVGSLELRGRVRYSKHLETGHLLGVQFEPGCRWSRRRYRPKHMLDPRTLLLAASDTTNAQ